MNIRIISLSIVILLLCSCATQGLYYWGKYSNTLYNYKKDFTEESLEKHIEELHNIITKSNKKNLRVPPGIYAELGYYYSLRGENQKSIKYLELEKSIYPESNEFIDSLIKSMEVS